MNDLADRQCLPCSGSTPPLTRDQIARLHEELTGWEVVLGHHLRKVFTFPDFAAALRFVNRVGEQAEQAGHHPDIGLAWGRVEVQIWTHKIDGLAEADFVLAARIDRLPRD